jgi:type II secretory ATPase GspE/PulE/Tfp pilus assembly ATPase PilB-like protein
MYELMTLNDEMRDLVLQRCATGELRDAGIRAGMHTLREAGITKILAGVTSIEEVVGETMGYA